MVVWQKDYSNKTSKLEHKRDILRIYQINKHIYTEIATLPQDIPGVDNMQANQVIQLIKHLMTSHPEDRVTPLQLISNNNLLLKDIGLA
jgi:hypothetical protein